MQPTRQFVAGRRSQPRHVWLVTGDLTPRRRPSPIGAETARVYEVALARVRDLRRLFPDFYQQQVADRQLTPRALYAVVCAFLGLVNRELFELEDYGTIEIPHNPLQALHYTEDDVTAHQGPLLLLEEGLSWLCQPQAVLYGIGLQGMLDDEAEEPQCALTLALWKLCQNTEWSAGVDVADVIGYSYVPDEVAEQIKKLHPLPAGVSMRDLCAVVALPGYTDVGELIRYAFARTDNPMANVTNYEVEVVYGGEITDGWDDALGIAENAQAARRLVGQYGRWAAAIEKDPKRELRALSKALHDAARASVEHHAARTTTLMNLLIPDNMTVVGGTTPDSDYLVVPR
jgi:hypothetical protein